MSRLLDKSTLRKLYEQKLYTSPYIATIEQVMERYDENNKAIVPKLQYFLIDL